MGAQGQVGLYAETVSNPTCTRKVRQFFSFSYSIKDIMNFNFLLCNNGRIVLALCEIENEAIEIFRRFFYFISCVFLLENKYSFSFGGKRIYK